jgi:hypothetical protein
MSGLLLEELVEGDPKMIKRLEIRIRRTVREPWELDVLHPTPLPLDLDEVRLRKGRIATMSLVPTIPLGKTPVPRKSGATDGPRKRLSLRRSRMKLNLVRENRQVVVSGMQVRLNRENRQYPIVLGENKSHVQ